ncbi:hypothetical protein K501DRAFT_183473 [Backusella circina FSU 941]|nr:hypothetical protein K501DRAFT_183473 [Backusella circina FSU 941]
MQNIILVILGIGMCFCLQRANRLIPNRFNFPLVDRRGAHHLGDEEDGLLSHYNDDEEEDAELFENQDRFDIHSRGESRTEENNQQEPSDLQSRQAKKPTRFGIGDEEEEEEEEDIDKST